MVNSIRPEVPGFSEIVCRTYTGIATMLNKTQNSIFHIKNSIAAIP